MSCQKAKSPANLHSLPAFLLLLLHELDVIGGNVLQHRHTATLDHVEDLVGDVALDNDLVEPLRVLRDGGAGREARGEELGALLQVDAEGLEPVHGGDVLALIALDAFDGDLRFEFLLELRIGFARCLDLLLRPTYGVYIIYFIFNCILSTFKLPFTTRNS